MMKRTMFIALNIFFLLIGCKKQKENNSQHTETTTTLSFPFTYRNFVVDKIYEDTYYILEKADFENIYSYLFVGTDKALLFDTGLGIGNIFNVVKKITKNEIIVLNSHSHYDHIGGNYLFENIYATKNQVSIENSKGMTYDEVNEFYKNAYPGNGQINNKTYSIKAYKIKKFINNVDSINLGNRTLSTLSKPGHSGDDIILTDAANKTIFIGDIYYDGLLFGHLPTSNFKGYQESAITLNEIQSRFTHFCSSHSKPMADFSIVKDLYLLFEAIVNQEATYSKRGDFYVHKFLPYYILLKDSVISQKTP